MKIKEIISKRYIEQGMEDRLGDCYRSSGRYVTNNQNAILVHGTINGVRFTGKDFDNPHAWIEEGDEVYDPVWDKRFPQELYYGMMRAKVQKKYDWEAASIAMVRSGHWGPW